jgi:poly-gamma-glutamate capsule biosynthesis protein CapA/YwtB (metallophosphatase superfamily)
MSEPLTVVAVGDVIVNRAEPESIFKYTRDIIQKADISVCQLETSYSDKGSMGSSGPRGAMAHDLRNYRALPATGFKVVSMASNHAMDWGNDALLDCIRRLRQDNIAVIGAGADIVEARQAAFIDCKGTRIALLSYCSVAPKGYYASKGKPGVAPMRAITHYEPLEEDQPGTPAEISTYPLEEDLQALTEDVRKAKDNADVVILVLHWGLHYFRAAIAGYQPVVARAAIDAGADIIVGHHAHMLKGIGIYKNKVILYSVGNFAFDSNPKALDTVWYARRRKLYQGLLKVPDRDEGSAYRFQHESRYAVMAKITIQDKRIDRVSLIPVLINQQSEPEPVSASDPRGQEVLHYLRAITEEAELNGKFRVEGDEAVVGE